MIQNLMIKYKGQPVIQNIIQHQKILTYKAAIIPIIKMNQNQKVRRIVILSIHHSAATIPRYLIKVGQKHHKDGRI